ncbi:integrator complex subunit 12 [Nasonia vitripennis]|uniref:Integrator complex subunit 12 n=1 Tax=Nasonia vitripennis TaxID=7425 RepID=A0A7M6UR75_NASVI|nr:integrator complex subunit 12 [Nasonia vitripennis]
MVASLKMTSLELDPQFLQALRLLHSTNRDSIEQLRSLLDEAIKQKYGAAKMLSNTLHKKYSMEEPLSDQSSTSSKKSKSSSSSKHSKSSKNNSPITVQHEIPQDPLASDDNLADILEDVACVICKGMDYGAKNRLVECNKCGAMYHQECHTPPVLDTQIDTTPVERYCYSCTKSQPAPKERNSPKTVTEFKSKDSKKSSSSSSKHSDKYKSSSSSSQQQTSNSSSSSSTKVITNIISASRAKDIAKKMKDKKSRNSSSGNNKHSSSSKSSHEKSSSYKNKSD